MGFMKSMRKFAEVLQTTRKNRGLLKSTTSRTFKRDWTDPKATETRWESSSEIIMQFDASSGQKKALKIESRTRQIILFLNQAP